MRRRLDGLPPLALPDGYTCRRLRSGEEAVWAQVLNGCGELGHWDEERVERALAGGITRERIWFVCAGDQPVATACVCLHAGALGARRWAFGPDEPIRTPKAEHPTPNADAEIGWVAVVPERQGRRLGAQVTLAACHAARELGFDEAFLLTDDFRLPAIKTYLNLGFEPDCRHESHAGRWEALRRTLGPGGQE